jgi:hypothetical protein
MQKKHFFSFGFIALVLVAGYLALNQPVKQEEAKATCCKKTSPDPRECTGDTKTGNPVKTDLENLSHQFIFIPTSLY